MLLTEGLVFTPYSIQYVRIIVFIDAGYRVDT